MTCINVNPFDNDEIWISLGNFEDGYKVYHSTNGGRTTETWENISYNLPNFPVQCFLYVHQLDLLLAGTDVGCYALDTENDMWYYFDDMPRAMITDLELRQSTGELFAATYGWGNIW